jgi:hypothetical protein
MLEFIENISDAFRRRTFKYMKLNDLKKRADDVGCKSLWNVGKLVPEYKAQQPRRQPSLSSPSWET